MSLGSKVILSFLGGTFSALLAWVVIDFNGYYRLSGSSIGSFSELFAEQAFVGAVFGIFVGMAIGLVNGLSTGSSRLVKRDTAWGAAVGLGGGLLGLFFGQLFFGSLYVDPRRAVSGLGLGPLVFIWDVLVRAIGWALIGLFLGMAQGLPIGSKKAARHGAVGGFIGGLLGGTLFEIVPYILPPGTRNPGVISRGISLTITGASIGLFIGLVETLLKQAWIRVVAGRNEGKEYIISKNRTTIGRDELSDVGLFGDRNISPLHAVIDSAPGGRHVLRDMNTAIGTAVNGRKITEDFLRDGDLIEIGPMRLEFHEKATASKVAAPVDIAPKPGVRIPSTEGICPYCGTRKDPVTGACACTVGAPVPPASSPAPMTPSPAPSTGFRLTGTGGPYAGQSFPLSPSGVTTIGREPGRDVQLAADSTVSRKHARIVNEGGGFVVYDEGSSNGTAVNSVRITRQELAPGDVIAFGTSEFRLEQ